MGLFQGVCFERFLPGSVCSWGLFVFQRGLIEGFFQGGCSRRVVPGRVCLGLFQGSGGPRNLFSS